MAIILYQFNALSLYGWLQKTIKRKYETKTGTISRSEAENRNSTIPTARETLLDNTVTNGSRANSLRFVKLGSKCVAGHVKQTIFTLF